MWDQCSQTRIGRVSQLARRQQSPLAPRPWLRECLRSHGTPQNRLLLAAQDSQRVGGRSGGGGGSGGGVEGAGDSWGSRSLSETLRVTLGSPPVLGPAEKGGVEKRQDGLGTSACKVVSFFFF